MRMTSVFALSILAAGLVITPAPAGSDDLGEPGQRPLSETLDEAFRSLMEQMTPAFEELVETFKVFEEIDSIENYLRPEILPNGDVIIRRREDAPPLLREDDGEADPDPDALPSVKI